MKNLQLVVVSLAGIAVGFLICLGLDFGKPAESEALARNPVRSLIVDSGESATIKALRARIAELEKELAARRAVLPPEVASNGVARVMPVGGDWRRRGPREFFEEMKKSDPVRYAQMTNRMAQWQQRRAARAQSRMEYLSSIDVSHMSSEAKKVHSDLQELLAAREALEQRMRNPDLTDDERHSLFDEMRDMHRKISELNQKERSNLLEETARELGFSGDDVKDISAAVQDVIEATDSGFGGRGGPGGHPGPMGGPLPGK